MTIQVIIIGGGVAGLTLALALEHSPVPIKYVLLERRDTLTPQVGASIGLAPNGSRILDQLGVYETLSTLLFPISSEGVHDETGQCLAGARTEMFKLIPKRTGYPVAFLERRELLRVLWEAIRQRAAVLTGKKVVSIEQGKENAVVVCADGTRYTGDIVVGADGVHSTARTAMWQQNAEADEDDRLTAEYKCLFGIADPVRGLDAGSYDVTQAVDVSTLVITGKGDQVYWFLFGRMPCVYRGAAQIPRFTTEDAEKFVGEHLHLPIRPQGSITLAHIWKATKQATLTALEEADFQHWAGNRIVCIGDSAHKMTPNSGAGGMLAIESAAALANAIWELASNSRAATQPEITEITDALRAFETDMHARATSTIRAAAEVTRLQALRSFKERILARFVLPYAGDTPVNIACDSWVGARCIKYLPPPPRSLRGHTPFNPAQGIEHEPPLDWKRHESDPYNCISLHPDNLVRSRPH
ncbi:FAD-dependent oxidoreductase [Aspergillus lucknowensis]|uniref:FAD-binding domain-containing protein n=1 Tax=Aspergillus lucknowensis TaxID=176173 RepID=A0ABR4LCL3_9EURO